MATQPPTKDVTPAVIEDLQARTAKGIKRYGRPLQTHNGRNALQDAYEEALDLSQYLKQALMEVAGAQSGPLPKEAEATPQFQEVAVVSSVVCYGCGRLVQANECRPAVVVMETGEDGGLAFYCREACAGIAEPSSAPVNLPGEHQDGGAFLYQNGCVSSIKRRCSVCGEGFDPIFKSTRAGCLGKQTSGS